MSNGGAARQSEAWLVAPVAGLLDTCTTLQLWAQIVGKVRLARAPMVNHWWQATLYLTARGLTTSVMPDRNRSFQIDFDLIDHRLLVTTSDGRHAAMALASRPLAEFYAEFLARLGEVGIAAPIWPVPVEMAEAVPFPLDRGHAAYDAQVATRFWRILLQVNGIMEEFRGAFLGKSSPVHLFWGGFDLAVTRFSGRQAPEHPGGIPHLADRVTREGYSHELASWGFWPGTAGRFDRPAFFAYAYPAPEGFAMASVRPAEAAYDADLREFLLPYDAVQPLPDLAGAVKEFLQSTYEAAADLGGWDRAKLERGSDNKR